MRKLSFLFVLAAFLLTNGCKTQAEAERPDSKQTAKGEALAEEVTEEKAAPEEVAPKETEPEAQPEEAAKEETLLGTVEKRPWTKSMESWDAGGSEYYVIKVDGGDDSHILRFSEQVPFESFEAFDGKHVEAVGHFVEAKPYVPESPTEQYPTGMNGEPASRGSGFQVTAISEK